MPPRTRGIKASKTLKENLGIVEKKKVKPIGKNTNPTRKALADKTNSASDDNASIEKPKNVSTKVVVNGNAKGKNQENCVTNRPRRERKLPNRFEENHVLKNLSNNKDSSLSSKTDTTVKNNEKSSFKTPQKCDESSLLAPRPTRASRLPSRFEDHSMSPHQFIPVQPLHSSTPTVPDNGKKSKVSAPGTKNIPSSVKSKENKNSTEQTLQKINESPVKNKSKLNTELRKKASKEIKKKEEIIKNNADTNINPHQGRNLRVRKKPAIVENSIINDSSVSVDTPNEINTQANAKVLPSPKKKAAVISTLAKKITTSYRVLDKKQSEKQTGNNVDVYEFTFDPNEEPPPQKKKKKRIVKKKPIKPKTVITKSTYEDNISKALSVLKSNFAKKPVQQNSGNKAVDDNINNEVQNNINSSTVGNINPAVNNQVTGKPISNESMHPLPIVNTTPAQITTQNSISDRPALTHNSVRIEDIVLDFQNSNDHHEINYSPVNSPYRPKTPIEPPSIFIREPSVERHNSHDPLNLKDNLSFFDDQPIANSSMNVSARHPHASPWRVEFQNLPIKWHVNSYVKPNMTPAVECSFVNFNDSNKRKHVYTNLVPQSNEELPEIVEKDTPNLIQTSIISFIKEVAERSATKKRGRSRSTTPATLFNDLTDNNANKNPNKTPRQVSTPKKNEGKNTDASTTPLKEVSGDNIQLHKGISREYLKRKCNSNEKPVPAKTPRKNMDNTYFGFDETDEIDQENVLPKKTDNPRARALRPRARAVLKEINEQSGPVRANIPLAAKSGTMNSDTASKLYEQMKSAADAPVFPDENAVMDVTDINNAENNESNDEEDSQSVHLFEDIELIHNFKQPHHKSYGKAKKVAFQVNPSDSETQDSDIPAGEQEASSEEDDLLDLTFEMPAVEEKKKRKLVNKKKQKFTKKEEAEAEAWAAGFNSMCEEVEDFPLVVE